MRVFMDENFLLKNGVAVELFHKYAAYQPIFDYHCHLSPKQILDDQPFENITEVFLGGDHYKWRYMRSCGVNEKYVTGNGDPAEKFTKWCEALQYAVGNPLYHWTHLELARYFNVKEYVTSKNAANIYDACNQVIRAEKMSPKKLIEKSNVYFIGTTDDPSDRLEFHAELRKQREQGKMKAVVAPSFRPDNSLSPEKGGYSSYIAALGEAADMDIRSFKDLLTALSKRINAFDEVGCRASDHGLENAIYARLTDQQAENAFERAMKGQPLSELELEGFKTEILLHVANEYAKKGWVMQLHFGAQRNNNTKMFNKLGADTGYDSVADTALAKKLSRFMDALEQEGALPKTILYTLNPKDNYVLGTMLGNFQNGEIPGKIQFGSGWWFCDQKDGMIEQMKALANLGSLAAFVGMLTDSRSFLSYPRHEYFRRILCNVLGEWVEDGEFPNDMEILGKIVRDISFENARKYFNGVE